MCVFLIEDEKDILEALTALIGMAGHDVLPFDNAREAMERLRQGARPDVIVLDIYMQGMDGFEFRRQQLADVELACIPVVVLSGAVIDKPTLNRLGAVRFLSKPVPTETLLASIALYTPPESA